MLVLSRKPQETIIVDGRISITVVEVRGNQVRLGIQAPKDVIVQRQELRQRPEQRGAGQHEVVLPLVRAPKSDFRSATTEELFSAETAEDSATTATL